MNKVIEITYEDDTIWFHDYPGGLVTFDDKELWLVGTETIIHEDKFIKSVKILEVNNLKINTEKLTKL